MLGMDDNYKIMARRKRERVLLGEVTLFQSIAT